jgi:hypothetical protein
VGVGEGDGDGDGFGSLSAMVTRASGPTSKFGLTAQPVGLLRRTRKVSSCSFMESFVVGTENDLSVSLVNETVCWSAV